MTKRIRESEHRRAQRERLNSDNRICRFCASTEDVQAHHIAFYSKGGTFLRVNLIATCRKCHDLVHSDRGIIVIQGEDDMIARGSGGR